MTFRFSRYGSGRALTSGSDDQLLFGSGILAEYDIARGELLLSDHEIADIAYTSFRASGAPIHVVKEAESGIAAWLAGASASAN